MVTEGKNEWSSSGDLAERYSEVIGGVVSEDIEGLVVGSAEELVTCT